MRIRIGRSSVRVVEAREMRSYGRIGRGGCMQNRNEIYTMLWKLMLCGGDEFSGSNLFLHFRYYAI
jgi:hypothetical protein